MRFLCRTPAVWDFDWHQKGVAWFEAHSLATDFRDKFASENVYPFVLLVMHVQRRAAIRLMLAHGNQKNCKPPLGIERTNQDRLGACALVSAVGFACKARPDEHGISSRFHNSGLQPSWGVPGGPILAGVLTTHGGAGRSAAVFIIIIPFCRRALRGGDAPPFSIVR